LYYKKVKELEICQAEEWNSTDIKDIIRNYCLVKNRRSY